MKIKIAFSDGGHFCKSLVAKLFAGEYEFIYDQSNPDVLVYSLYGNEHRRFRCKKICVMGENSFPDFNECDYAVSPHYIEFSRHLRVPFYAFNKEYEQLVMGDVQKVDAPERRAFCGALVSNNRCADPTRAEFVGKLAARGLVCSAGGALNTMGRRVSSRPEFAENLEGRYTNPAKIKFQRGFKFSLALENSSIEGYHTEKITDAFASYSVPVYWGSESIIREFDPRSFVNVSDFKTLDDAIDYMQSMPDADYLKMLNFGGKVLRADYMDKFREFLRYAFAGPTFEHSYGNIRYQLEGTK